MTHWLFLRRHHIPNEIVELLLEDLYIDTRSCVLIHDTRFFEAGRPAWSVKQLPSYAYTMCTKVSDTISSMHIKNKKQSIKPKHI